VQWLIPESWRSYEAAKPCPKRSRDSDSTKSDGRHVLCSSCSSFEELAFFNISHRRLALLFDKLIGVVVLGALENDFVVTVVCSRKKPHQNRADKLTNDEATTL
jgi:hypothetical protein